jgi:hypothetical protein
MKRHEIGKIIRLQIQVDSLKSGPRPFQTYSPANILSVNTLHLTAQGAWGVLPNGTTIMDAHHQEHHAGKNRGDNALSLNFTSHYGRMQQRFGNHLELGCAGENILVETAANFTLDQLGSQLLIQSANNNTIRLHQMSVADPCEPFSRYCLNLETQPAAAMMKATLQFLDNGTRGFYLLLAGETAVTIHLGDRLFTGADHFESDRHL